MLFFYPLDFTFVCPTEIIEFSEHAAAFRALGAEVVGVSVDSKVKCGIVLVRLRMQAKGSEGRETREGVEGTEGEGGSVGEGGLGRRKFERLRERPLPFPFLLYSMPHPNSEYTHLAWTERPRSQGGLGQLDIPLIADITKSISRDYGVLIEVS